MEHFFDYLMKESREIAGILGKNTPMMPLTEDEIKQYQDATECPSCKNKFTSKNVKVRHHDHLSGHFLSALCNNCNLKKKYGKRKHSSKKNDVDQYSVPLILHNLGGYD
jgi:hypothetical protein